MHLFSGHFTRQSAIGRVAGWMVHYGGDTGNTRYSPFDQITAANFNKRQVAWRFSTGNLGPNGNKYRGHAAHGQRDSVFHGKHQACGLRP